MAKRRLPDDMYTDHVLSDWEAVKDKERFTMAEKNDTPTVEQPVAPAAPKLVTIATSDRMSAFTFSTDGMHCSNCHAIHNDTTLEFCTTCGVGYVVHTYLGIKP